MDKELSKLSFLNTALGVKDNERLLRVRYASDELIAKKSGLYLYLKLLNHEGLLPKGYMTRVNNHHIKYDTLKLKCQEFEHTSKYFVRLCSYKNIYLLGLVERV